VVPSRPELIRATTAFPNACARLQGEGGSQRREAVRTLFQLREQYLRTAQQAVTCSQRLESKPLEDAKAVCDRLFDPTTRRLTSSGCSMPARRYDEALKPLEEASRLDPDSSKSIITWTELFPVAALSRGPPTLEKAVALCPDFMARTHCWSDALYVGDDLAAFKF